MRLIDANGLMEDLKKWKGLDKTTLEAVEETVGKQPTAYNVDKVKKEVERQLTIYTRYYGDDWRKEAPLVRLVKTVEEGEANE